MDHYLVQIFNVFSQVSSTSAAPPVHWTAVLTALMTPMIAVFGVVIATQQVRIASSKLKLDLYDKRIAVYDAAKKFVLAGLTTREVSIETVQEYLIAVSGARWLFDKKIQEYLDREIWDLSLKMTSNTSLQSVAPTPEQKKALIDERTALSSRLHEVFRELDDVFHKYLHINH